MPNIRIGLLALNFLVPNDYLYTIWMHIISSITIIIPFLTFLSLFVFFDRIKYLLPAEDRLHSFRKDVICVIL